MISRSPSGPPAAPLLRYQLRFRATREPESLIAIDVADALRQARRRASAIQSPVSLWRDGALIAECSIPADPDGSAMDADLLKRLVTAGFYVYLPTTPGEDRRSPHKDQAAP